MTVERNILSQEKQDPKKKVALIDIDAGVGFLPDLVEEANRAQGYYGFRVAYLPIPSGAVRTGFEEGNVLPQLFLPRLEGYLGNAPQDLDADVVCCLTSNLIAGEENGVPYWNRFEATLEGNPRVSFVSTFRLRRDAEQAGVPFTESVLNLCLRRLTAGENGPRLGPREEVRDRLPDPHEGRGSLLTGLNRVGTDHAHGRGEIGDPEQLGAIDELLALGQKPDDGGGLAELGEQYAGYEVRDRLGEKIGELDDMFVGEHDWTEYIGIKARLSGTESTLIPMEVTKVNDERQVIEVSEIRSRVEEGPIFEDVAGVTLEEQERVRSYYGLESLPPSSAGREEPGPYHWSFG